MEALHPNDGALTSLNIEEAASVRAELEAVLSGPQFCNSKRYPALLRYVVESTLAGRAEMLKERTLGTEVFGRKPDYDTGADTIVRYTASEVRRRLLLHYRDHSPHHGLQIALLAGSYVPSFVRSATGSATAAEPHMAMPPAGTALSAEAPAAKPLEKDLHPRRVQKPRYLLWCLVAVLLIAGCVFWLMRPPALRSSAVQAFWKPVYGVSHNIVLCTGGVVFDSNTFSGVHTAGRDTQYPFVSLQIASSVAQISGTLQRGGASYRLIAAGSSTLTDLREGAVVLFGAYNNPWALRLMAPLRLHFQVNGSEEIVDSQHPGQEWKRNTTQGYGSGDDYALIARFHDPTTGSLVVALAGLGRNGTEAAAQFVSSEPFMSMLRRRIGPAFDDHNLEILLKTSVVDGRTGVPVVVAVQAW